MGVTEDVINAIQAPKTRIVVAVSRKHRVQLEYKLQTTIQGMFTTRARNGTKFELANKSVIILQISGPEAVDIDTMKWKAKEWNAWITDTKLEEKKSAKKA